MKKIVKFLKKIQSWFFSKIFGINWLFEDISTEEDFLDDDYYSNCRRHGGSANIINCYECYDEYRDDDKETEIDDDDSR